MLIMGNVPNQKHTMQTRERIGELKEASARITPYKKPQGNKIEINPTEKLVFNETSLVFLGNILFHKSNRNLEKNTGSFI